MAVPIWAEGRVTANAVNLSFSWRAGCLAVSDIDHKPKRA
jgi:hypothetical protein